MSDTNENNQENTNERIKLFKEKFLYVIAIEIVIVAIGFISVVSKSDARIDAIENNIAQISSDIKDINTALYGSNETEGKGIYYRLSRIEDELNISPISASNDTVGFLDNASISYNNIPTSTSAIPSDICIGSDADGKEYFASDVINEKIFLTYNEDGKDIFFLGQFDENYHWNGYCITNTYNSDGTLYGICESNFDGGNRLDYISFYQSSTENEWIYTNRECKEDGNYGESIRYSLAYNKIKNFTDTNVRVSDFIYIDDFISGQTPTVLTYYYGKTSDGLFNDSSDDAYEIIFDDEGYVKVMYIGSFKDGNFDSDNAKEIVYDDTDGVDGYLYCESAFEDGNRLQEITIDDKIDQRQIDLIVNEIDMSEKVKSNLKWR